MFYTMIAPVIDAPKNVFLGAAGLPNFYPIAENLQQVRVSVIPTLDPLRVKMPGLDIAELIAMNKDRVKNFGTNLGEVTLTWRDIEDDNKAHSVKIDLGALLDNLVNVDMTDGHLLFSMGMVRGTHVLYAPLDLEQEKQEWVLTLQYCQQHGEEEIYPLSGYDYRVKFTSGTWWTQNYRYSQSEYAAIELNHTNEDADHFVKRTIRLEELEFRFIGYVVNQSSGEVFAHCPEILDRIGQNIGKGKVTRDHTTSRQLFLVGYVPPRLKGSEGLVSEYVEATKTLFTNNGY